ncbi:hypothetical protein [Hydrogenophaga sp. ZJX-1]|uniref:hypothetical protein n=1 Tax=Hydrogenophaga sp. ZJX-1 TaxID=3404778 RepID=UPI003B285014
MGIRFNTNTWRAPLLLIDSWLPPSFERAGTARTFPKILQRFVRAGWLGHPPKCTVDSNKVTVTGHAVVRARHVRVLRTADTSGGPRSDGRLVISGRINDVCAELERLAALELQSSHPQLRA